MDRRSRRRPIAEINVVPYIDVMLVLLVIFMITAPLLKTGVEVTLPKADAKPMEQTQSEPLIVTVDGEGRFFINIGENPESPIGEEQLVTLATAAMRRDGDRRVLVRGDQGVNYQKVVRAMALLQRSGVPQVGLVAEAQ
ncbi:protein TolR [Halofilum ochraceum]|uniref:protein TolR n=1 Tax=Halofilum ochraceum TaxID=1611323 RepID=UPI00082C1B19|nr:protein TolR [Halofilum ochraceum]